jgi:hypothetical protein
MASARSTWPARSCLNAVFLLGRGPPLPRAEQGQGAWPLLRSLWYLALIFAVMVVDRAVLA